MNEIIRVGIIGAGGNTILKHIPLLQKIEGVEVVSIANRSINSSKKVASQFEIKNYYDNWINIVDDDSIDAIVIGTWPYMHKRLTIESLESGKHVLCEARMSMNTSEAQDMLDCSQMYPNLISQIVPAPHTLPIDKTIKRLISSGYLGRLINLRGIVTAGNDFPKENEAFHWRNNRDLSGNNVMQMGIWYEAIMRWIGPAKTVLANSQTVNNPRIDEQGNFVFTDIPDHLDVLCEMIAGGTANLQFTMVSGMAPESEIWIHGTEGTLVIKTETTKDPGAPKLILLGAKKGNLKLEKITIQNEEKGAWRVEEEFINAIRGNEIISHTSFTDGVKYMKFTDAIYDSCLTGEKIHI
jgi:predicted dehydrogenase